MEKLSICIPTYNNEGVKHSNDYNNISMLLDLFKSIEMQTFKDYEVIISDHSIDNSILVICEEWKNKINIKYHQYTKNYGSCEANLNNAMKLAKGKYIKPILQDDYIISKNAIDKQINVLDGGKKWVASGCLHINENNKKKLFKPHPPNWGNTNSLLNGVNLIGSPSVIMHVNDGSFYDINLILLMDVEFYYLLFNKYGVPSLINDLDYVSRLRSDGISNTMISKKLIEEEKNYLTKKYIMGGEVNINNFPNMYNRILKLK